VQEVKIMKDKKTKMPKGYGFVIFKSYKTYERIKDMPHSLNGRTLDINVGCKKENDPQMIENRRKKMVYVGGVPLDVTEGKPKFSENLVFNLG
jgi:heterogeneous nuclear ribonucleoprotein A1/A3